MTLVVPGDVIQAEALWPQTREALQLAAGAEDPSEALAAAAIAQAYATAQLVEEVAKLRARLAPPRMWDQIVEAGK